MARRLPSGADALTQSNLRGDTLLTCRYKAGTTDDADKSIPFNLINSSPIAVCSSGADAVSKVATVSNYPDFTLVNGAEVVVYFANGNTATNPSLNINGTGAIQLDSGYWNAGTFIKVKYVDITVSGTRIQKYLVDAGAYNTTTQLNGALTEQGIYTTVSDLNELQAGQTCIFTVDTLNRPTTYGKCICYKANNWLFQKATTAAEEHPSEYIREKLTDGNWGSWQEVALKSDISNSIRVLEAGVIPPEQISANNHIHAEISLQHTYALANISFILTPVSYVNCAYITATGHWGYETQSSEGMTQSNGLTIYITNIYSTPQTCGCYYQIIGTDSDILI